MVPRMSNRLLQPNQAVRAMNLKNTSGRIDPLLGLSLSYADQRAIKTAWRYRHFIGNSYADNWLTWSQDVDAVRSLIATDQVGRFYFTSDEFEPRMSTFNDAIQGTGGYPAAWFGLGVAAPLNAPTIAPAAGSTETRAYVYTFVTKYGEESGPSPAAVATGANLGAWTVSGMQAAPSNTGTISAVQNNVPSAGKVTITFNTTYGLVEGESLTFSGVVGMTDLNGTRRIFSIDAATNKVVVLLSTTQTYTSGGAWAKNSPHNLADMTRRIYRSAGTNADYLFVAEVPVATTSYVDNVAGASLGEVLPTKDSLPAPGRLRCLKSLPNGCLVGITDNEICFSAPYMPYSWPISNRYSFSQRAVNIVPSGNSVIVLTDTYPILFVGNDPEAMTPSVMETYAPCLSKRGVADVGGGAIYPSHDGLWLAAPGRVERMTQRLYREDEWKLLNPSSWHATIHDGQYYGFYTKEGEDKGRMWVFDMAEGDSVLEVDEQADDLYRNDYDGQLYVSYGQNIYQWDVNVGKTYVSDWLSMTYQLPKPINFSIGQVHAEFSKPVPPDYEQIAANEALIAQGADAVAGWICGQEMLATEVCGSFIIPAYTPQDKKVQFTLYADNEPVFTRIVTSSRPFRLPSGYRSEVFNIGLSTSIPVYSVAIADNTAELAVAST